MQTKASCSLQNEFRKKYAKQRNYSVAVSPCLVVNVPLIEVKPKSLDIHLQAPEPDELSRVLDFNFQKCCGRNASIKCRVFGTKTAGNA